MEIKAGDWDMCQLYEPPGCATALLCWTLPKIKLQQTLKAELKPNIEANANAEAKAKAQVGADPFIPKAKATFDATTKS